MLRKEETKEIFAKRKAIITGSHFVYARKPDGWYHGSAYVSKDAIYPYVDDVSVLCKQIACYFVDGGDRIDVVVGPTVGAVSLAQWTTHWFHMCGINHVLAICADEEDMLETREIPKVMAGELDFVACGAVHIDYGDAFLPRKIRYTEKIGTRRVIKRGYDKLVMGKRCLIVEDVINSGLTVVKTRDAVLEAGGEVIGVACLCNRSGGKVTAGTLCVSELFSLLDMDMQMFPEDDCPICKEKGFGSVRTDLGKGKDFLVRKGLV